MRLFALTAVSVIAAGIAAQAQEVIANPTLEDGSYIVKYDMENHKFAESNDFEIDETFVFAIDVTGTSYVDALSTTGRNPEILGRGMARDIYANNEVNKFEHFASGHNLDGRLFHIEGNVYGMTVNFKQLAEGIYADGPLGYVEGGTLDACQPGVTTTFGCNVFPFGWTAVSDGAEWWNAIAEPITTVWFTTLPYTGTKTSRDFYFDDFTEEGQEVFPGCNAVYTDKGWAMPQYYLEALGASSVGSIDIDSKAANVEYFNLQGVKVLNPGQGIYIRVEGGSASKVVLK